MPYYIGIDQDIIKYFMSTTRGIKATARHFGLSTVYVGKVILKYKKNKGIR